MEMISKVENLGKEFNNEEDLEKFFLLLRKYNSGKPIDKNTQFRIHNFLNYKWQNDRNNFLLEEKDKQIFSQLPGVCQRQIYTDFLFQEFLYKFRRFFSFRTDLINRRPLEKQDDD